jgi:uncharacterized protein
MAQGNDCARGFMRGTVRATTAGLSLSTMRSATDLILTMMLCHEHDEEPEMRPNPISPESSKKSSCTWRLGFRALISIFRSHRQVSPSAHTSEPRHNVPKVGRNSPSPCGSGKKYKQCCGGTTIN